MTNVQHTPGPYCIKRYLEDGDNIVQISGVYRAISGIFTDKIAQIICEAMNAHHETGLTPRQLAERYVCMRDESAKCLISEVVNEYEEREELLNALRKIAGRKGVDGEKLTLSCMANIAQKAIVKAGGTI